MVIGARQLQKGKTDGALAPSVVASVADCVIIWCVDCTISLHSYLAVMWALPTCRSNSAVSVARHTDHNSVFSAALPGTPTDARGFLYIDTLFATLSDESKKQATDQRIDARASSALKSLLTLWASKEIYMPQVGEHLGRHIYEHSETSVYACIYMTVDTAHCC